MKKIIFNHNTYDWTLHSFIPSTRPNMYDLSETMNILDLFIFYLFFYIYSIYSLYAIHFLFHQVLSNQEEAANIALLSLAWTKRDPPFSLLNLCYLSSCYGYYLLHQNVTSNLKKRIMALFMSVLFAS